ncbi:MAG: SWIM zinc finger family protein [Lachnospiraceae bacterium]|nr:SWIM zinc finger family protein [Lachnospiraceae bacterium]
MIKKALQNVDDDYLTALSNKGILKRAYKDLEQVLVTAKIETEKAELMVGEESCTILPVLADSTCSCPSRSICRHIVTGILWLKQNQTETKQEELSEELFTALQEFPLDKLQKVMKKKYYSSFLQSVQSQHVPEIEESSVIVVTFPAEEIQVRLLYPLEYAVCTCHSKELCKHKAAAILAWKLHHKLLSISDISVKEETLSVNAAQLQELAEDMEKFFQTMLVKGLVRIPEDMAEQAESLAVRCHRERFAKGEAVMRELGNRLRDYHSHVPEFDSKILVTLLMKSVFLCRQIKESKTEQDYLSLLGVMRNSYEVSESMVLIPIGFRDFSSKGGYEGQIYYFLKKSSEEEGRAQYFSYSDVRPNFYGNRNRKWSPAVPWGLEGTLAEIMRYEIHLEKPKISQGKISSSKETKAELGEEVNLNQQAVQKYIYTDFEKMVKEILTEAPETELQRMVLVTPKKCISSEFHEISQSWQIVLEDGRGHRIMMKARYQKKQKSFFENLSKIGELMLREPEKTYVIFGSLYMEKGNGILFPVAVFDDLDIIQEAEQEIEEMEESQQDYVYFIELFYEMKEILKDMVQCGIGIYDFTEQIAEKSRECEKSGLLMLSRMLDQLYGLLQERYHSYHYDYRQIIQILAEWSRYLDIGIQKTELAQVGRIYR